MSQMTVLLVKDDAATPVEYAFHPVSENPIPHWQTRIAGLPREGQMRYSLEEVTLKSGDIKTTAKLEVPVMETVGTANSSGYVAAPKVAYVNTWIITSFKNRRHTIADASNGLKMSLGLAQGATSTSGTGTLNQAAAGNAFSASAAPVVVAFVSGEQAY